MNSEDDNLSNARHSIQIVEDALDLLIGIIIEGDMPKLENVIHKKGKKLYSSISQAEYNISIAESLKEKRIREMEEIKELEKQSIITREKAMEAINACKKDVQEVYHVLADSRRIAKKLDFIWNFISWKYNILLSKDMEKIAKTNNRLAIAAVGIAIVSLAISLIY